MAYVRERIGRPTVIAGNSLVGLRPSQPGRLGICLWGVVLNAAGPFSDEQKPPHLGAIARQSIGTALLKSPVLQRLLFENLRRPATIRRTLNQVYVDKTSVDDWLVESIRRPSLDPGAFGVFRTVFDIPRGQPLDELFAEPRRRCCCSGASVIPGSTPPVAAPPSSAMLRKTPLRWFWRLGTPPR